MILDVTPCARKNAYMGKQQAQKLGDQIRQAVVDSGVTRYRIAKDCKLDEGSLSRFVHGHCGLSLESLDRLGEYLGLTIKARKRKGR